jgi:hypothetical protein
MSETISAGHLLHTQLEAAAQRYLSEPSAIGDTQASVQGAITVYNGSSESENEGQAEPGSAYDILEKVRTEREPQLAALARIIGDKIVIKLLDHTDEDGLGVTVLGSGETSSAYSTFLDGVSSFMDEAADEVSAELKEPKHPYNPLYRLFAETHKQFMEAAAAAEGNATRNGTQLDWGDEFTHDRVLRDIFSNNHRHFGASLLIMYGIATQDVAGELPTAEEFRGASAEEGPHWLALLKQGRQPFFSRQFYGREYYRRIKQELEATGVFPDWVTDWSEGLDKFLKGENQPFKGCSTEAPLLYRRPKEVVPLTWKTEKRCSGQIATYARDPEDNNTALRFSQTTGGGLVDIENNGRYSAGGLLIGLGRLAAVETLYANEESRAALIEARQYRGTV